MLTADQEGFLRTQEKFGDLTYYMQEFLPLITTQNEQPGEETKHASPSSYSGYQAPKTLS
jgi:hypothetical protein